MVSKDENPLLSRLLTHAGHTTDYRCYGPTRASICLAILWSALRGRAVRSFSLSGIDAPFVGSFTSKKSNARVAVLSPPLSGLLVEVGAGFLLRLTCLSQRYPFATLYWDTVLK